MDLHAHVTLPQGITANRPGWKKTDIILEKGERSQIDTMMTRHYRIGQRIQTFQDIIDDATWAFNGIRIERLKIEQDSDFFLPINKENYLEIHMLVPEGTPELRGWVMSRNPRSIVNGERRFFMNKRIYNSKRSVEEQARIINRKICDLGLRYFEFKVEQVVFDSNRAVDGWWA